MADFIFDGANRRIRIDPDNGYTLVNGQRWYTFSAIDMYSAWKRWVQSGAGALYPPAFRPVGGQDIGGGVAVGTYIFMMVSNGWKGVPPDVDDIIIKIEGNLYPDIAGTAVMEKHPQYTSTLMLMLSNKTEVVTVSTGVSSSDRTLLEQAAANDAATVWDKPIEGNYTAEQIMRVMAAALAGKVSGAGTGTVTFRDINDLVDRITADVDGIGNRTDVRLLETVPLIGDFVNPDGSVMLNPDGSPTVQP